MENNTVNTLVAHEVEIPIDESITIKANMCLVKESSGIVLFAHGSGSGRFSPRNKYVASILENSKLSTLLIDLLTPEEEVYDNQTRRMRFDIELLCRRVVGATKWIFNDSRTKDLNVGYYGASTGAAAALMAAAKLGDSIKAVVSRGGRPDLAGIALKDVKSPTLLIVGGNDSVVIELNKKAAGMMSADKIIQIIPGATHLFEEAGTLEKVAELSGEWFSRYL